MSHISAVTQKNKASTENKTRRLEEHNRDVLSPIYNVCFCLYVCDILVTKICSITLVIGERLSLGLFVYHYSIRKYFSTNWKSKLIDSHSYSVSPRSVQCLPQVRKQIDQDSHSNIESTPCLYFCSGKVGLIICMSFNYEQSAMNVFTAFCNC